jgi:hypothetical protein
MTNIQSNRKTKFDRVITHINLRRILFETYDILLYEDTLIIKGIKTDKYKMILQSVNDQKDFLLNIYDAEYDNECYTDQHSMMDDYYKEPRRPHFESLDPLKNTSAVTEYIYPYSISKNTLYFRC